MLPGDKGSRSGSGDIRTREDQIDRYQATLLEVSWGRAGTAPPWGEGKPKALHATVKAASRDPAKVHAQRVVKPDGTSRQATSTGVAPGSITSGCCGQRALKPTIRREQYSYPNIYSSNADTINFSGRFSSTPRDCIFGVLMARGRIDTNPLWFPVPLPHPVVAGTVMPGGLFPRQRGSSTTRKSSQHWKLAPPSELHDWVFIVPSSPNGFAEPE